MVVLFIDTCNKMLVVGLSKDDKLIYRKEYECFKKQSEYLAKEVDTAFKTTGVSPNQVNRVVVTNGPGSYTGIRIGLTFAKVFASVLNIELVVMPSLLALVGKRKNALSLIDARSNRAYYAAYDEGKEVISPRVDYLTNIDINNYDLYGDTYLFNKEVKDNSILDNMLSLHNDITPLEDSRSAKAMYLND